MIGALIAAVTSTLLVLEPVSPPRVFAERLAEAAVPVRIEDRSLAGPGGDVLLERIRASSVVVIGEQHLVADVPGFTALVFEEMCREDPSAVVVLETEDRFVSHLSGGARRGNVDRITEAYRDFPMALAFGTQEELAFIARAGAISRANPAVRGVERPVGAAFVLDRLTELSPSDAVRRVVQPIAARAAQQELARLSRPDDFRSSAIFAPTDPQIYDTIGALLPTGDPPFDALAAALLDARDHHVRAMESRSSPRDRAALNQEREAFLRDRIAEILRDSPTALIKMGALHAHRFRGPGGSPSAGERAAGLAAERGRSSLHLLVVGHGAGGRSATLTQAPFMQQLQQSVPADHWSVIDLSALRSELSASTVRGLAEPARELLLGFDLMVLISPSPPATWPLAEAELP